MQRERALASLLCGLLAVFRVTPAAAAHPPAGAARAATLRLAVAAALPQANYTLPPELAERALVHHGNPAPLRAFLGRWAAGEELTVAVLGGSVTVGHKCSACEGHPSFNGTYSRRVFDALVAARPPGASIPLVYSNGAVPSTGPPFFASCLAYRCPPEASLVLLEFAVNGVDSQASLAGAEGVVRQLLARKDPPALIFVDWFSHWPGNVRAQPPGQDDTNSWTKAGWWQQTGGAVTGAVAEYYGIPRVSLRAALLADDFAATPALRHEDFGGDWSHPNGRGHAYIAQAVVALLARVAEAEEHSSHVHAPASPLVPAAQLELAAGRLPAALMPLVPGNRVELLSARLCAFGPDLRDLVARSSGWVYDAKSDPLKPGWLLNVNATANALVLNFTAFRGGQLAFTAGWDAGQAVLSCSGGCACQPHTVVAYRPALRVMETLDLRFSSGGAGCELSVVAGRDAEGHHGFKVLALILEGPGDSTHETGTNWLALQQDGRQNQALGTLRDGLTPGLHPGTNE